VGVRSNAAPDSTGDHMFFFAPNVVAPATPWTISIATRRSFFEAASAPSAVTAGVIALRNGSPIDTPSPLRTARRDRCFLVRYTSSSYRARATVSAASFDRVWNAELLTTPRTNDD